MRKYNSLFENKVKKIVLFDLGWTLVIEKLNLKKAVVNYQTMKTKFRKNFENKWTSSGDQ